MTLGASAPVPKHLQTFLAFDFGIKRTGVATGNRLTRTASRDVTDPDPAISHLHLKSKPRPGALFATPAVSAE